MIKLKTIIVDDEPLALGLLKACLSEFPEIDIIGSYRNGREAIDAVLTLSPDLMFLDIHMPEKNGFEVVHELQSDIMPMIIFVTTYQQYALDAFDLHAVDYISKPLDEQRLARAVNRAVDRYRGASLDGTIKNPLIGAIDELVKKISDQQEADLRFSSGSKKIAIRDAGKSTLIDEGEIDWIEAAGDYMCVHSNNTTHIMRSTVKELLDSLDDNVFKRIHRSTVVNIHRISTIQSLGKGDYLVCLQGGERLKVSRHYNAVVREIMHSSLPSARAGS